MTFSELVTEVSGRLNLTSTEALGRIERELNDVYRQVTSSLGINTARKTTVSTTATISNPRLTVALDKVDRVSIPTLYKTLNQSTYDEVRQNMIATASEGDPCEFAIEAMGGGTTTLLLYPTPSTALSIDCDGTAPATTQSGDDVPAIPVDFHDVLVHGVMKIELMKMEKAALAGLSNADYQTRLAELRYFIIKSGYLNIHQNGTPLRRWMR